MATPDFDNIWKSAFSLCLRELEGAEHVVVAHIYSALRQYQGDLRKQSKALIDCLGATGWRWSRFEGALTSEAAYKKMAASWVSRIDLLAHALHRRQQLLDVTDTRPYWEFCVGPSEDAPERCKRINGTIKRFDDPFWEKNLPPCENVSCRCQVFSLSERDMARRRSSAPR